jgi:hypothetical protein
VCRGVTRACFHHSDFQSKNFLYAIFIVKKRPLYVNFSIPPCGNWWFSQCSTPCVGMRFCGHVPNSPRNKNPKEAHSISTWIQVNIEWSPKKSFYFIFFKVVFLDPKRLMSSFGKGKKNFFFNFECYDFANGNEWECKIW